MEPLARGTVFAGRYEILRGISVGGMGMVYEVLHKETQRRRALKVMLPSVLLDEDMRARFRREAIVTADIESEHIVEIFDAGVNPVSRAPFLVMELLRGEDLSKPIERGERFTTAEVVELMTQLARALDKTHRAQVIHRDLKPENLFVTRRDDGSARLKVLDFGIAKLVSRVRVEGMTTRTVGTPLYMAPEQMTGDAARIGPAADLYAIGHIAFTMLVGHPYWHRESLVAATVMALLLTISKGAPDTATSRALELGVGLPPAFDAWFARATSIDPGARFEAAVPMIRALAAALDGVDPTVTSSERRFIGSAPTVDATAGKPGDERQTPVAATPRPHHEEPLGTTRESPRTVGTAQAKTNVAPLLSGAPGSLVDDHDRSYAGPPSSRTLRGEDRARPTRLWLGLGGAALVAAGVTLGVVRPWESAESKETATAVSGRDSATTSGPAGASEPPIPSTAPIVTGIGTPSAAATASASASAPIPSATAKPAVAVGAPLRPVLKAVGSGGTAPTPIPTTWGGPRR